MLVIILEGDGAELRHLSHVREQEAFIKDIEKEISVTLLRGSVGIPGKRTCFQDMQNSKEIEKLAGLNKGQSYSKVSVTVKKQKNPCEFYVLCMSDISWLALIKNTVRDCLSTINMERNLEPSRIL